MTKLCIDLCSGLGGFSRAFVDAGWEVITVDINPKFNPTICGDVRSLEAQDIERATATKNFSLYDKVVLLASPPCNDFSTAGLVNGWPRKGIRTSLDIIGAIFEIVAEIRESCGEKHAWLMENPVSIIKYFTPKPTARIRLSDFGSPFKKPTYLWGNIPLPLVIGIGDWEKAPREMAFRGKAGLKRIKGSANRSLMPLGLSQAILEAVTTNP